MSQTHSAYGGTHQMRENVSHRAVQALMGTSMLPSPTAVAIDHQVVERTRRERGVAVLPPLFRFPPCVVLAFSKMFRDYRMSASYYGRLTTEAACPSWGPTFSFVHSCSRIKMCIIQFPSVSVHSQFRLNDTVSDLRLYSSHPLPDSARIQRASF